MKYRRKLITFVSDTGINRTMVHHWWKQWKLRDVTREVCVFTDGFFSIVCGNCILTYCFLSLQVTGSSSCVDGPPQATRRGQWYIEDQSIWYIVMIGLTLHFRLRMCCSFNYAIYFHLSVLPLPPTKFFFLNKRTEGAIENNYWGGGPQCFPCRLAFFLTSRTTVRLILAEEMTTAIK